MKSAINFLFGSNPEGRIEEYPCTEKEKVRCRTISQEISRYVKKNYKMLEVAAGNGWASFSLIKKGFDVVITDKEDFRIKQIKENSEKIGKKVKIVQCDAEKLPFPNSSFDLIFCIDSLHHMDPQKVLKEIRRVLKPRGKVIITEKNYLNPMTWIGDKIFNLFYDIEEKTFTKSQITSFLKEVGFKTIETKLVKISFLPISCPILYICNGDEN
jgi:ubiquinone/menaquinone biosynthesis C-methylase UbiE